MSSKNENGSVLIYILIAIALLAALTSTFMDSSSQQTRSQNSARLISDLSTQIRAVRSAINECVLLFPNGDGNAITATAQLNQPYPIMGNHTYFSASTDGPATNDNIEFIGCPGNPGDNVNHKRIYGASSGNFLPPAPNMFNPWRYYAGEDGIFYWIETTKTDAFIDDALTKLDSRYSQCEAEYIDASSSTITMTSDAVIPGGSNLKCAGGSRCFRLWVIRKTNTDTPDDTACN